ncbi:MAG TPA: heme o synthase [Polyangiaceae bacterium]|jgi:protoheme IX farnesyltransferase|nr:heme o synthase [Polyangiaceae bacterium]
MQSVEARSVTQVLADLVALTKPRITLMVVLTGLGGYWLATRYFGLPIELGRTAVFLAATALVVSGANALNMFIERDSDALMARTRMRPLPNRRLAPEVALAVGLFLSAISVPWLTFGVNPMTGLLGAVALGSYVLVYTPMKRRSPVALLVGSVPGALPPLMGWAAARGTVDGPGLILFGIMFLWQVPHFLAIATFRKEEYARAGLLVLPVVRGDRVTRHHVVRYLAALVLMSLLLVPYGIGGTIYLVAALALGAWFFVVGALGLRQKAGPTWARQLFFVSMIYLMGIFGALTAGTAFDSSDAPAARADAPASLELASNAADSVP